MGQSAKGKTPNEIWGLGGQLLVLFLHDAGNGGGDNCTQNRPRPAFSYTTSISSRAQSTITICALLFFVSLVFLALSTSDFTPPGKPHPRRWLSGTESRGVATVRSWSRSQSGALQGMGTLFLRGNRAMSELLVAHLAEDAQSDHLRWFLRMLHRSGLTARADVVLIFPALSSQLKSVIREENEYFAALLASNSSAPFNATLFRNKPNGQPLWGRSGGTKEEELEGPSWGSVVGFESAELDPEDSLAGFLDPVGMQLRRWACYRMLLGRVRRNFKHVMLVGVKDVFVAGDAFGRLRNRKTADAVWIADHVVVGGMRGIRRLSDSMLTEIVRVSLQRKNRKQRNQQHDSQILTHLVKNSSVLNKKIKLTISTEPIPSNSIISTSNRSIVSHLRQTICSSTDQSVYKDC